MKNNQLALMLLGVLLLGVLIAAYSTASYNISVVKLKRLTPQLAAINGSRMILQSLGNDLNEYGKKNPDLQRVLQPAAATARTAAPAVTPKPASR